MNSDVVMAGFGGQGLMAIGKILAKAAMHQGRNVTWMPSYGPEMRGGTANCVVVIDDEPVASPVVQHAQAAIVMNKQSIDKFEPTLVSGGLLVINTSLIDRHAERSDLRVVELAANSVAEEEGSGKSANMVMLGAYVGASGAVLAEEVEYAIAANFGDKKAVAATAIAAFRRGYQAGKAAS